MNEKKFKTIGILGGMGPAASANFYKLLVKMAQENYGAVQDHDFPEMIIYNLALRDFDQTGFTDRQTVLVQLRLALKRLQLAGADFAAMACNTVHAFHGELQRAVDLPILDLIALTAAEVEKQKLKQIGLLASCTTNRLGLYQRSLSVKGVETVTVNQLQQARVDEIILKVMAGKNSLKETEDLSSMIEKLKIKGAQAIILGCTELPLAVSQKDSALLLYNTLEILAKAALRLSYE